MKWTTHVCQSLILACLKDDTGIQGVYGAFFKGINLNLVIVYRDSYLK